MLALVARSFPGSPAEWLDLLVIVSLKATVVLALAAVVNLWLARASAAARHLTWSVALIAALALPLFSLGAPGFSVRGLTLRPVATTAFQRIALSSAAAESKLEARGVMGERVVSETKTAAPVSGSARAGASASANPSRSRWSWVTLILGVWALGATLVTAWLMLGVFVLSGLARGARPVTDPRVRALLERGAAELGLRRPVALWSSAAAPVPCTWGLLSPRVLLPSGALEWPSERLRVVLLHELAHVVRRDCLMQTLGQLACAVLWFHPLAWHGLRRLRIERERACDDRVLGCDTRPTDYADHLLAVVRAMRAQRFVAPGAVAFARPSHFEGRLLAVLDARQARGAVSAARARGAAVAAGLLLLPLALLRPWAGDARASLTLHDGEHARPQDAAASELVQVPEDEGGLVKRVSWAMAQADQRRAHGYWIAYEITRVTKNEGDLSDSGDLDLATLGQRWKGPRLADVLAGFDHKEASVEPRRDRTALAFHFPARGTRPEDVDRIRVQAEGLAADFGRQPLFWLGAVDDRESFEWARRVENGARNKSLRGVALEAVAAHADGDAVRAHLVQVLQSPAPAEIRATAAKRLARFSDEATVQLLATTAREDVSQEVRESALEALGEKADEKLSARITPRPGGQDIVVYDDQGRPEVTIQQGHSRKKTEEAAQTIEIQSEKRTENREEQLQGDAVEALAQLPVEKSLPKLVEIARTHPVPSVRRRAIEAIADQGCSQARDALLEFAWRTKSDDSDLAQAAVEGLAQCEGGAAKLCEIAKRHQRVDVRRQAVESLGDVEPEEQVVATLDDVVRSDPDESVQKKAVEAIAELPEAMSLSRLESIARSHPNPMVRKQAIESLGEVDPDNAAPILESLIKGKKDGS